MKRRKLMTWVLLICTMFSFTACGDTASENTGDPKPSGAGTPAPGSETVSTYENPVAAKGAYAPQTILRVSEQNFPMGLTLTTLQGLAANLGTEQIMISTGAYNKYAKSLETDFGVTIQSKSPEGKSWNTWSLLAHFKDRIAGYILCDEKKGSESVNIAISLCKQLNAVAVTEKNEERAKEAGLQMVLDVRGKDDAWLRNSEYFQNISRDYAFAQAEEVVPKLADYAAMTGGYYNFYGGKDQNAHKKMYDFMNPGGLVFGYNNALGEHATVNSYSELNLSMVPADHAHNLSTLSSFKLEALKQKTARPSGDAKVSDKHTVCFVMSDGDNMQWFVGDYATSAKWYASKHRGNFNMGWGLAPLAIDLAAPVSKYYYDTMTEKDNFIFQLSGLGYTFPSRWTDAAAKEKMAAQIADYMKRTDVGILEILDDYEQDMSKFDQPSNFDVFTQHDAVNGLFYIDYFGNYNSFKGKVVWSNEKPVVSARYSLWATGNSADSPEGIARAINRASKDTTSTDAYSFVIVHAWSGLDGKKFKEGGDTMAGIQAVVDALGENVDVVTPDEFVHRMKTNVTR